MKILLYSNTDWFMHNFNTSLADELVKRGHDVVLLTPPGKYGEKLEELGFNLIRAPMVRGSLNIIRELNFIYWLTKLLRREKVDIIHSFTLKCAIYGSIAAYFARVPTKVNSITGMGYVFTSSDFKARILRPIITILMRMTLNSKSARLVVLNSTDFDLFKTKRIVKPEYIRLIPGAGIDCTKYTPSKTHVNAEFRVLLAARLLWDKGVAEYIQASRLIKNKGLSISFLLAGAPDPGNPAAVPESLLVKWVSEGLIKFLGHIDDMPSLLKTINVVVLPSYREGLPTGLTEAGACGLSIITTDVPGCNEVVTHEIDGLLVPVKDSAALADAIQRLYLNPELCKKLGEAARYNAVARFDNKIVIGKTLDIYEELKRNSSLNNNIIN